MAERFTLDELYHMTAYIYSEQNAQRPLSATFSHFVEVCGTLTMQARKKKREGTFESALCRALGWFFPLVAKCKIASLEAVVFQKFPYACPYCRQTPHQDAVCKRVRGTEATVNHAALRTVAEKNAARMPRSLGGWMTMFQEVYPRSIDDPGRSTIGLMEELGELAEGVRVFDRHPKYLVGEIADVFSYLMGLANEHSLAMQMQDEVPFRFEQEYLARYPGVCLACGNRICTCPSVPDATVGRMAKELDIDEGTIFLRDQEVLWENGRLAARDVLAHIGGVQALLKRVPLDRGDVNRGLIVLCMSVAESVEKQQPSVASGLRALALQIAAAKTDAGSKDHSLSIHELISGIQSALSQLPIDLQGVMSPMKEEVAVDVSRMIKVKRILLATASPADGEALEVDREARIAIESVRRALGRESLELEIAPSVTADDLRRRLLEKEYHVVHLSGHGAAGFVLMAEDDGSSSAMSLDALRRLIARYPSIECVLLNACSTLDELDSAIGPITVGMSAPVSDRAALAFTRGFYDALGAGKSYRFAVEEGKSAVALRGYESELPLKVLE